MRFILFTLLLLISIWLIWDLFTPKPSGILPDQPLLQVDTAAIRSISLEFPDGKALILSREDRAWLVSNGIIHGTAKQEGVHALLNSIARISAKDILSNTEVKDHHTHLLQQERIQVRIFQTKGKKEEFQLGPQQPDSIAWIQLEPTREWVLIDTALAKAFRLDFRSLHPLYFTRLPDSWGPDSLLFQLDSLKWHGVYDGTGWIDAQTAKPLGIASWIEDLKEIPGPALETTFNEIDADPHQTYTVTLFEPSGDSLTMYCYFDTLQPNRFILRSSQFPDLYYGSDSNGLFRKTFYPLLFEWEQAE